MIDSYGYWVKVFSAVLKRITQVRTLGGNGRGGAVFLTPPAGMAALLPEPQLSEQWEAEFKMNSRQPFLGTSAPILLNPPCFL